MSVLCDDDRIDVPLHALRPTPRLVFNPVLSFNKVLLESTTTAFVDLKNLGHREAVWSIEWNDESPVRITPSSGTLAPRGKFRDVDADGRMEEDEFFEGAAGQWVQRVQVDFTGEEVGEFRMVARVKVHGQPSSVLDISATVIDQKVELVMHDGGGVLTHVPFGALHFGESREVKATLINNGPVVCSFSATVADRFEVSEGADTLTVTAFTAAGESFVAGSGKGPGDDNVRATRLSCKGSQLSPATLRW